MCDVWSVIRDMWYLICEVMCVLWSDLGYAMCDRLNFHLGKDTYVVVVPQ